MNDRWKRVIQAQFHSEAPLLAEDHLCQIALAIYVGDAPHHEQWWKEELLRSLGITREELCQALYGWDEREWPDKGVAP